MSEAKPKRPGLIIIVGLAMLGGIPLARWWMMGHASHPFERLAAEKQAERDAIVPLAKVDLACNDVDVRMIVGDVYAYGCGKRLKYVRDGDTIRREGDVERDESTPDGCHVRWTKADAGDAGDGREAALRVKDSRHAVRTRLPISLYDVKGLGKLRYGETIDVYFELDAGPIPDTVPGPCIDPSADGGYAPGTCPRPWSDVSEIDECN